MNQKRVIAVLISILICPFLFFLSASTPPNLLLGDVALYIVAIAFCLLIASKLWRRRRSQIARLGTVPLIVKTRVISFLLFAVVGLLFSLLFWPDIYRATEFSSGTDANSASTVHFCPPPNVRYLGTEYRLRRLDWNAAEKRWVPDEKFAADGIPVDAKLVDIGRKRGFPVFPPEDSAEPVFLLKSEDESTSQDTDYVVALFCPLSEDFVTRSMKPSWRYDVITEPSFIQKSEETESRKLSILKTASGRIVAAFDLNAGQFMAGPHVDFDSAADQPGDTKVGRFQSEKLVNEVWNAIAIWNHRKTRSLPFAIATQAPLVKQKSRRTDPKFALLLGALVVATSLFFLVFEK